MTETMKQLLVPISYLILCGVFLVGCQTLQADPPETFVQEGDYSHDSQDSQDYQEGELIIQLKKSDILTLPVEPLEEIPFEEVQFHDEPFQSLCQQAGVVTIGYVYPRNRQALPEAMKRTYLFRFRKGVEVLHWVSRFEQSPEVEYAEPNQKVYIQ